MSVALVVVITAVLIVAVVLIVAAATAMVWSWWCCRTWVGRKLAHPQDNGGRRRADRASERPDHGVCGAEVRHLVRCAALVEALPISLVARRA
jgi:hypothetical protein